MQRPAAPEVGFVEQDREFMEQTYSNACFCAVEEPDGSGSGGLRMGALYDFVYQFIGQRRPCPALHALAVYLARARAPIGPCIMNILGRKAAVRSWRLKASDDDVAVVVVVFRIASYAENWQLSGVIERSRLREDYLPR